MGDLYKIKLLLYQDSLHNILYDISYLRFLFLILNNILMIDVNDDFFIKSISISTYNQFYDKNSGLMFKYQKFFENELNTILKEDLINIDKELIGKYYLIIPFNLYILYVKSNSMISFYFCKSFLYITYNR